MRKGVIKKKPGRILIFFISHFSFLILTACGLQEFYYLPPVTQVFTISPGKTVEITLPDMDSNIYFENFTIFYRIYLSDEIITNVTTANERQAVSRQLNTDYTYFFNNFINVTSPKPVELTAFESNYYYKIETDSALLNSGKRTIQILFTEDNAVIKERNSSYELPIYRNTKLGCELIPNKLFKSDENLKIFNNDTGPGKVNNRDVFAESNKSYLSIYVSMYIVTEGYNIETFNTFFSRPTHIGVFKID